MLLSTAGLTKEFDGVTAVDDVDFSIEQGELCSVIGPNGAGKTTFFNLLTGVLEPTRGRVEFVPSTARQDAIATALDSNEELASRFASEAALSDALDRGDVPADAIDSWITPIDITEAPPHETALLGLHRSYQITNVFPTVSVLENVRIAVQAHRGNDAWKFWRNVNSFDDHFVEAEAILERVGLSEHADLPAENLSHGENRNLEIAIALAGEPDLLLLDEPTAGVSSEDVGTVTSIIEDVASDHAIMLIEHNMDVVMDISDRVVVLDQGEIIADGPPEEIRESEAVRRAYLGGYGEDGSGGDGEPRGGESSEVIG